MASSALLPLPPPPLPPFNDWRQPGIAAAASFPLRRAPNHRTPLRAYKSPLPPLPPTRAATPRRGGSESARAVRPVPGGKARVAGRRYTYGRRYARARSVHSKLLSATTARAPPPAAATAAAAASRTRTRESPWPPPERTRVHSTEWNAAAADVVSSLVCVTRASSSSSSYSVTVRVRRVIFTPRDNNIFLIFPYVSLSRTVVFYCCPPEYGDRHGLALSTAKHLHCYYFTLSLIQRPSSSSETFIRLNKLTRIFFFFVAIKLFFIFIFFFRRRLLFFFDASDGGNNGELNARAVFVLFAATVVTYYDRVVNGVVCCFLKNDYA